MPRPRMKRNICHNTKSNYYKPAGIPSHAIEEVFLRADEMEAFRLCDGEGLSQEEAAKRMNISQPTLNRALSSARQKVAKAIVNGCAISIEKP